MNDRTDILCVLPDPLRAFAAEVLRRAGVGPSDAERIAGCLVQVDLRGVFSHGTRQLGNYVRHYQSGKLNPFPRIAVVRETPGTAVLDGDGGIGYLVACRAAEILCEKAAPHGIALVGTRHHGHGGSQGIYAHMALRHGLVYFGVEGGGNWEPPAEPGATVWDAMKAPPMCFGIPAADGPPLVADINTHMFREFLLDSNCLGEAMERIPGVVIRSMGLKFVATLLGGSLAGALDSGRMESGWSAAVRGCLMIAFHPDAVGDAAAFKADVTRIIAATRRLEPLPGLATAEVAGSLEWERERAWSRDGIPLARDHRRLLEGIAAGLSLEAPWTRGEGC